ncbi:hypothetical protein RJ640_018103 [Escallonia rubra]|uniref:F-box domain-containing protein n=1 Tax=Escallonia rubra TaxID=112253 RepID=A0AA88QC52_9ASTE|nr:hypothetical protein RJ640_018103 [Escallonia rubra]
MSGGTPVGSPVGGGFIRQRHSQGYASSGDDLEDDACSRPASQSALFPKTRTWVEVLENLIWIASAVFIVYYGDRHSNFVYLLLHDDRIRRIPLYLGLLGVSLNVAFFLYTTDTIEVVAFAAATEKFFFWLTFLNWVSNFIGEAHLRWVLWCAEIEVAGRSIDDSKVDSTACLCRVDSGLKTVAGAKKFVPGTKLCLQPNIKPSIHPSRQKPSRGDRNRSQSPLLPGLPDDLAIACLIRVPRIEHRKLRLVCRRWHRLLAGNFFYSLRKSLGIAEEWIYIMKRDRDRKISWHAFDPIYQLWQPLPPVPKEYSEVLGFGCAVLSGCHLYLFGGKDPVKGSMRRVIFYSARSNKWHRAPDMLRRRHFFGSCVINNCLYVAGGENEGVHRSLRSAEVYDPNKNRWSFISDMSTAMVPFIGVVYEGKWFLKGLGSHRQVLSEMYQPETDCWYPVYDGMVAGWRNPSTSISGHLYALDCKDGCKLRIYDEVSDSWSKHIDSKLHLGNSKALEAAALVPLNGKLCIIRNNMSISLVDVSKSADARGASAEHLWETIAGKGQFKTLVTNLWSSLAGRNRLKSHIVHCQVLQA